MRWTLFTATTGLTGFLGTLFYRNKTKNQMARPALDTNASEKSPSQIKLENLIRRYRAGVLEYPRTHEQIVNLTDSQAIHIDVLANVDGQRILSDLLEISKTYERAQRSITTLAQIDPRICQDDIFEQVPALIMICRTRQQAQTKTPTSSITPLQSEAEAPRNREKSTMCCSSS